MAFHPGTEVRLLKAVRASLGGPPDRPEGEAGVADAASRVLEAADRFCWEEHWMMLLGDVKGSVVDDALSAHVASVTQRRPDAPFVGIEFGTYVGYSAVRLARHLPANGKFYSCDPFEEAQAIAKEVLRLANISCSVSMLLASAQDGAEQLRTTGIKFDFVFIDHDKQDYLSALRRLEDAQMLRDGALIVADNVDVFQINDYLDYVRQSSLYRSHHVSSALEYTPSGPDDRPLIADGLEVSTFVPPPRGSRYDGLEL